MAASPITCKQVKIKNIKIVAVVVIVKRGGWDSTLVYNHIAAS